MQLTQHHCLQAQQLMQRPLPSSQNSCSSARRLQARQLMQRPLPSSQNSCGSADCPQARQLMQRPLPSSQNSCERPLPPSQQTAGAPPTAFKPDSWCRLPADTPVPTAPFTAQAPALSHSSGTSSLPQPQLRHESQLLSSTAQAPALSHSSGRQADPEPLCPPWVAAASLQASRLTLFLCR